MYFRKPPLCFQNDRFQKAIVSVLEHANLPPATTLVDVLRLNALEAPEQQAYRFLNGQFATEDLSYAELDRRARQVAVRLQALNAQGERVVLLNDPGLDYIVSFLGCLYAGAIAVPLYPPKLQQLERHLPRLLAVVANATPRFALIDRQFVSQIERLLAVAPQLQALQWLICDEKVDAGAWQVPQLETHNLAFLQYTSGSTGQPKGVMVSHGNLLANLAQIQQRFGHDATSQGVIWLPPYHDMGLIGGILQPLYSRFPVVLMSPVAFLQQPWRWLQAISDYRATTSGGPNFAYELCVRKITPAQRATLDLRSWRVAFNGAEPIRPNVLRQFAETFADVGFDPAAFYPTYGMAEATLMVSGAHLPRLAQPEPELISCGTVIDEHELLIVDPTNLEVLPETAVGEIWLRGPSVAHGYWASAELSKATFAAQPRERNEHFLRTGDLGFLRNGELYINGRLNDLIIIRGQNHYAHDLELSVDQAHPALQPQACAAFSLDVAGVEQLVLMQELRREQRQHDPAPIMAAIRQSLAQTHGLQAYAIVLLRPGQLPRTSSGKLQRYRCRELFLGGELTPIAQTIVASVDHDSLDSQQIRALPTTEQPAAIATYLRQQFSRQLGFEVDVTLPIQQLGLDSLAAIDLQYQLEQDLGLVVGFGQLLGQQSLLELADELAQQLHEQTLVVPTIAPSAVSFGEQALWALDRLHPNSTAYTIARAWRFEQPLDPAHFAATWASLAERHAALRTNFVEVDGVVQRVVHAKVESLVRLVDANAWDATQLHDYLQAQAKQPFDLANDRLVQVQLIAHPKGQVLLLLAQHTVVDLQSLAVLLHEAQQLYQALAEQRAWHLPPAADYREHVAWQQAWLASPAGQASHQFWQQQTAEGLPTLELPSDYPRHAQPSQAASYHYLIENSLLNKINAQPQTLLSTLLAGVALLLNRYSQQRQFVLATPTLGRNAQSRSGVGYYVNPVLINWQYQPNLANTELLAYTQNQVLAAFEHQAYPFDLVLRSLQHDRHNPPIRVMVVLQQSPLGQALELGGLALGREQTSMYFADHQAQIIELAPNDLQFDITITFAPLEQGLGLRIDYDQGLFATATIAQWSQHLKQTLEFLVSTPQPMGELSLSTPALVPSQAFETGCLSQWFEAQVAKTPDAIALTDGQQHWTYQQLNQQANQLAHYLHDYGIGAGSLVGLYLERSALVVLSILAVLKTGAAYLPIDPMYPAERVQFMLADADVALLLADARLAEFSGTLIDLKQHAWHNQPTTNLELALDPTQLAYVIYTSGSTGQPKGSLLSHANVTRLFSSSQQHFNFNANDVWTLFHSYAFDFSVWEMWGALLYGGRLVVVPQALSRNPEDFYALLQRERVTVLNQTPSAFRQLIQVDQQRQVNLALHWVIFGGEALDVATLRPWFERHGDSTPRLVNMYGITETTVHVTYRPLSLADTVNYSSVIGQPLSDLQAVVLDANLQPVPTGVYGELYIAGAGLAMGYLRRPDLTAERFMPHPWSNHAGQRLYKTGDLARWNQQGELEYRGRSDQQVKLRGFRIELGEIRAALLAHPAIREAVVDVAELEVAAPIADAQPSQPTLNELRPFIKTAQRQAPTLEQRLVAYVVASEPAPTTISALRRFLRQRLPDYMLPAHLLLLERLPLTSHGKLDRAALPAINQQRPELETVYRAPTTGLEQQLASIWSAVLGVPTIGLDDNFFDLGGDSILSIKLRAQAAEQGLHFSLQQLFANPTLAELAPLVEQSSDQAELIAPFSLISAADRQLLPADIEDAYPLARMQAGVIFHCQLEPNTPLYHDIFIYRIRVAFDADLLRQAVQQLIDRHAVLRTSFHMHGFSQPLQLVQRHVVAPLTIEDWRDLDEAGYQTRQTAWIEQEKQRHFDWQTAPLIRFIVQRASDDSCDLVLSFHDTIFDGWSTASLLTELMLRYDGLLNQQPLDPTPPLVQYRDFVAQEQRVLADPQAQAFWREALADASDTPLPRWPRPAATSAVPDVAVLDVPVSAQLSQQLHELARQAHVPVKHVLLAAHMKVISLVTGQREVISGLETNGRLERHDGEKTIGVHLNMLPFRQYLAPMSWLSLIQQVFAAELALMPYRQMPLAELQRERRGQPWFETVFNYTHFHVFEQLQQLKQLEVIGGRGFGQTHFSLLAELNLNTFTGQLQIDLVGNLHELTPEQLTLIGNCYAQVLAAMVAEPNAGHHLHHHLTAADLAQLQAWNATEQPLAYASLVTAFEQQALQHPHALAVVAADQALSYAELNQQANQRAHSLRQRGIGAEMLVAVCVERTSDLLISLLAVLKTGASYLPLDPSYPPARVNWMLADSQAALLLTQPQFTALFADIQIPVCYTDEQHTSTANLASAIEPSQRAYVLYTSGSTGQPKGVAISHAALSNFLQSMQTQPSLQPTDRLLAVTTVAFDIAGLELYLPLWVGATVVLAPANAAAEGFGLAELLQSHQITVLQATPSTWRILLATGWHAPTGFKALVGGEALPSDLAGQLLSAGVTLWNLYGPTETTIWSTAAALSQTPVHAGRPIANTEIYILDQALQPVPLGTPGDVYIGGLGLARGYHQRPNLTAERFIPHPWSQQTGARLYQVGDRGRYLPDGSLELLGRSDQQIKLRGHRIELGEIESALRTLSTIQQAAVAVWNEQLVAYVVADHHFEPAEVQQQLSQQLPVYMLPRSYQRLDALPLTANGKLDRRNLPAPDQALVPETHGYVAPTTGLQTELCAIWAQVFGIAQVGIHDDFFALGGHSLLATQLIIQFRQRFFVDLPLAQLFNAATVASLATLIEQLQADQGQTAELAALLDELDQLSDDEARARLLADF
ncbi:non-ribosomal peptide synthetase [Herpetosiphon sp.]|uniref:Amino acid adenylation domain n=1 Tax=Herpetosiphon aurantiacus (strain ATCC 23779 / DSM 785 / 114-95) TaxID=316274 RepID=A9AW98_HERA2|nr:amino acid adenylation domain [Herpetosiphon aurantiacus DSM 785]